MRRLLFILFFVTALAVAYSQTPQYINYQAVARDGSGNIITTAIGIKFQIYQGTVGGTLAYEETTTASPSSSGIFTVHIGGGTPVSGTFSSINWANGPYFLQVNIDPAGGTSYSTVGAHQLVSVPYALYAERAASAPSPTVGYASGVLSVGGNTVLVSSSSYTPGGGISIIGGVISNTAPNQTVTIASGTNISVTGAYPSYTVSYTGSSIAAPNTSVTGTGAATVTSAGTNTFNVAVATPTLVGAGSTTVSGTYPLFTITTPTASATNWTILGNAGTVDGTNFLGTTDNAPLNFRVNNQKAGRIDTVGRTILGFLAGNSNTDNAATAIGFKAMLANTTGSFNTAVGKEAMYSNTIGFENVAVGFRSLYSNANANYNTSVGAYALYLNTTGSLNSAFGNWTMRNNTTGSSNSAFGTDALYFNTTGGSNSAFGMGALRSNSTGSLNCSFGTGSMFTNTSGSSNTSVGYYALYNNQIGDYNTAIGGYALNSNMSSFYSTAVGYGALRNNTNGFSIGVGAEALVSSTTGTANVAMGNACFSVNVSGINNTAVGHAAGQYNPGSGNVFLGYQAGQNETGSNKLYIANNGAGTPLIYGDFTTERIGLGLSTPGYKLHVQNATATSVIGAINTYNAVSAPVFGVYASVNNPDNTSAAVYGTHSGGGNGVSGISTSTGFANTAGVYGLTQGTGTTNVSIQADAVNGNSIGMFVNGFASHTGIGLYSKKIGNAGSAGRFEIFNNANTADALFALTDGRGAAVHAASGPVATSTLALLVDNGHIKSVSATPPTVTISNNTTGFGATATITPNSTDVKGVVTIVTNPTSVAVGSFYEVTINYNKAFQAGPTIVVSQFDASRFSYSIQSITNLSCVVRVYNNTNLGLTAPGGYLRFNYMIIE